MEYLPIAIAAIACLLSLLSLLKSNTKEQSDRDKEQDKDIGEIRGDIKALNEKQRATETRVVQAEASVKMFDNKIGKEIEKLEKKIDQYHQMIMQSFLNNNSNGNNG